MSDDLQNLAALLAARDLELGEAQLAQLDAYRRLMWEWNEKINLTRHTTLEKFVNRDVVDSMAFANVLSAGERVLDVGSGGGVPGLILAIARPDLDMHVCDSVGKKARVLADLVEQLGLPTQVHASNAQAAMEDYRFDALTIRAVAPLVKLLRWFDGKWIGIGRVLVLKGPNWVAERKDARESGLMNNLQLRKLATYQNEPDHGESVLLEIKPTV